MKNSKHARIFPESFTPNDASKINYSLANVYLASKSTTEALMLAARKHTMPSMEVLYFEYASVLEHEWHRRSPGRTGQPRRSPALPLGRLARPTFALNFRSALWSRRAVSHQSFRSALNICAASRSGNSSRSHCFSPLPNQSGFRGTLPIPGDRAASDTASKWFR